MNLGLPDIMKGFPAYLKPFVFLSPMQLVQSIGLIHFKCLFYQINSLIDNLKSSLHSSCYKNKNKK